MVAYHFKEFDLLTGLCTGEAESYYGETLQDATRACLAVHSLRNPMACLGKANFGVVYPDGMCGGTMLAAVDPLNHQVLRLPSPPLVVLAGA